MNEEEQEIRKDVVIDNGTGNIKVRVRVLEGNHALGDALQINIMILQAGYAGDPLPKVYPSIHCYTHEWVGAVWNIVVDVRTLPLRHIPHFSSCVKWVIGKFDHNNVKSNRCYDVEISCDKYKR